MQKLQNSVFSILKATSLSPAVFSFLQPSVDSTDQTPLGGILSDAKYGWLALGPKFCVVDLRSGLKIASRNFEFYGISSNISVSSVVEFRTPLIENTQQLIISLECGDITGMICVLNINGSQVLRCIQTDVVITKLALCDGLSIGPFSCFDGLVMAGTKTGEIFVFDLNKSILIQALKDVSQGYEHLILGEGNIANLIFLPLKSIHKIERQRNQATENSDHLAVLLNENSFVDGQYMFCNPDGSVRMKANRNHIRITVIEFIPQLGTLAVGFNFGAFQLWNLLELELEFTSQVNVECLPVTHFGFQEPCDDPRAFCYLWVVFSVLDRHEDEEFPLAVMYSLTYQGKRMLSDSAYLYQEFSIATVRFQIELGSIEEGLPLVGGRCISCHTYSINSTLAEEGEDTMLNLCQLVWECWGENINNTIQHGMLLFDLDQWYKDQMPATQNLESNTFMSTAVCPELGRGANTLDLRLDPATVSSYSHATRLEEHFYPNSLQYSCMCLSTCEASAVQTVGIQRQMVRSLWEAGPSCLLRPARLHAACLAVGLTPLYGDARPDVSAEEQRRFLLSVALEARLSRFLKRCAQDWATGTHSGVGCTLTFLTDWCWRRAIELKENAKELTGPLFTSSILPDKNVVRCLEHCVQQLGQLTGLMDGILTKCCNLVVPEALSEMEEKYAGIGTVALYFQVVQWFLRVGLLPERAPPLAYPAQQLQDTYYKRRLKLHRLQDKCPDGKPLDQPSDLLYIDQLIENEFGGEKVYSSWRRAGGEGAAGGAGLYPPPSLCALARLYLRPDVHHDHKHALLLYLLLDYCVLYDDLRYETVIRRLMQFPTMFGLSNTAIKATQAFWHLDHRDFDFALDQLQCLTGNTLSDWQHKVVLSALLAQNKTQAALQYLHVRKPAPIQKIDKDITGRVNEHDKLEDWQSSCNLYLARGLVFEALDVIRTCVKNTVSTDNKMLIMKYFYKGCRNTGQLSKILHVSLLPFEEEMFIKYLQEAKDVQAPDMLLLYYLQQARYLEAEVYTDTIKTSRRRPTSNGTEMSEAASSLVGVACRAVPRIASEVARTAALPLEHHVIAAKPMSVFVQAKSPKNTFTYKSSFIQNTIENASETWVNRPKLKKGLKRALNIEDTPFICTPKLSKTKSFFSTLDKESESTPPKRPKLDMSSAPAAGRPKVSEQLSRQMAELLDMPEVQSPVHARCGRPETPQSILKNRRLDDERDVMLLASPVDVQYLGDSDDDLETASDRTHASDKHLRFTIPTASEAGSTPSPVAVPVVRCAAGAEERGECDDAAEENDDDDEHKPHIMESPPKKFAAEEIKPRKTYKDSVRARKSLSISVNSSLSEDPSSSVESIADLSVTLLNPRHPRHRRSPQPRHDVEVDGRDGCAEAEEPVEIMDGVVDNSPVPKTPTGRRSIRTTSESVTPPLVNRGLLTTERQGSPIVTRLERPRDIRSRSRSRTPELSPKTSLAPIPETPAQEVASETHAATSAASAVRRLRSRSRTPERTDASVLDTPRLEAIMESPTKAAEAPHSSPTRRSLRSRSRTPEVEMVVEQSENIGSPRKSISRSKTPEKIMSPKKDQTARSKKSLSRIVLEANTFAKTKQSDKIELNSPDDKSSAIECTPMKPQKPSTLLDVTFSPIINKSVLQSSSETAFSMSTENISQNDQDSESSALKILPTDCTTNEVFERKSVLNSYQSSISETASFTIDKKIDESVSPTELKTIPAFTTLNDDFGTSILKSCDSSVADASIQSRDQIEEISFNIKSINETEFGKSVLGSYESSAVDDSNNKDKTDLKDNSCIMTSDSEMDVSNTNWKYRSNNQDASKVIQKEKEKIVEIEREINEIEGEMSEDECRADVDSGEEEIEQSQESSSSSSSAEEDAPSENNDVISIQDSDDSNSGNKLEIDEASSDLPLREVNAQEPEIVEVQLDKPDNAIKNNLHVDFIDTDPLNQAHMSMLTDDNSIIGSEQSVNLNYSDENQMEIDVIRNEDKITNEEIMSIDEIQNKIIVEEQTKISKDINIDKSDNVAAIVSEADKTKSDEDAEQQIELQVQVRTTEQTDKKQEKDSPMEIQINQEDITQQKQNEEVQKRLDNVKENDEKEEEKPTSSRKRTKSTSSHKSIDIEIEKEEPKTPMTRKRTQSNASVTETEQKTPENVKTVEVSTPASRRRAKTPTSTEIRKILTRRASKELSESKIEDNVSFEEILTPRRRSARAKSNKEDDNASVISESSVKSTRSKGSEDNVKPAPIRKGRKSILNAKTDLSVIPEASTEAPHRENASDILNEYSSARRLTRHQKAVLDSWLEPHASQTPPSTTTPRRRSSRAEQSDTPPAPAPDTDATEGCGEAEDMRTSPEPASSTAKPRQRLTRAASDTSGGVSTARPLRAARRVSVDVGLVASPEVGSPSTEGGRGRRASFARAVQALHTPTRRLSTDQRTDTESGEGSPALGPLEGGSPATPTTPARRGRRASATSSVTKPEPGKRTRKVSDKNKEVKD